MSTASPPSPDWRRWHRAASAAVVVPALFYVVTGVALNHRRFFGYFQERHTESRPVARRDAAALREFLAFYKGEIGRHDDPAVIRIKGENTVEFLYGSHGQTTYAIDPRQGRLTRTTKVAGEPWTTLNRLHKAVQTPAVWGWISDGLGLLLLAALGTGLAIPGAWRRSRGALLLGGAGFAAVLAALAWWGP